jgi:hypothetical protein
MLDIHHTVGILCGCPILLMEKFRLYNIKIFIHAYKYIEKMQLRELETDQIPTVSKQQKFKYDISSNFNPSPSKKKL